MYNITLDKPLTQPKTYLNSAQRAVIVSLVKETDNVWEKKFLKSCSAQKKLTIKQNEILNRIFYKYFKER